ncbi:hypothetical protein CBER1_02209 [Cercospora berteroae]|uniref:Uncharacterized protein n=1 Tax=Cercospora berteroae TaxID=357750 RepID=A0A2S6BQA7_9PEZI|nr:hypothetical protein CBER1_02209 [Cercospora berteroae]
MADQRITGPNWSSEGGTLNPAAFGEPLDAARCAALHNHLMERGFQLGGENSAEARPETWWHVHGSSLSDVSSKLHPNVLEFLKLAWVSAPGESFFWSTAGIPSPDDLFANGVNEAYQGLTTLDHDMYSEDDDDFEIDVPAALDVDCHRFVTLYAFQASHHQRSPSIGVVFDQVRHMAIFVPNQGVIPLLINGHNTQKFTCLEQVLDSWHLLVDREKVTKQNGIWQLNGVAQCDLDDALSAWDDLVENVEQRILNNDGSSLEDDTPRVLLNPDTAASLSLSTFRRSFLTRARRPKFQWIAPGMQVPSSDELARRISAATATDETSTSDSLQEHPLLLFAIPESNREPWPSNYCSSLTQRVPSNSELLFPFAKNIDDEAGFAPGLYLSSTASEHMVYADSFRLILPFTLGANGFVRRTDFTWDIGVSEATDQLGNLHHNTAPRYSELYQSGNSITDNGMPQHDGQLSKLFETWKRQGEMGAGGWRVSEQDAVGVIGQTGDEIQGIAIIEQNADSWERWGNYIIGR